VVTAALADIQLSQSHTILQALQAMERPPKRHKPAGMVLVVDAEGCLVGVVTDGDVRRALLRGDGLEQTIGHIMNRNPITIRQAEMAVGSYSEILRYLRQSGRLADPTHGKIIVVDERYRAVDIISLFEILKRESVRTQTLCVVGMGFVGLTLAVALAEAGYTVHGIETQEEVLKTLRAGDPHIHEVGLERAFRTHLGKRLSVGSDLREPRADIYLICVGTPVDASGQPLLQDLETATRAVAAVLKPGDLVGIRSTVPIGATRAHVLPILEKDSGLTGGRDFDLIFVPERTVAGNALAELRDLPQVIGSLSPLGLGRASAIFRELTPLVITVDSLEEAEAVKLLNNAFRDHVFAFANEVAVICSRWGLDATRVIRAANEDYPRNPIPHASPGVGGVCLRKDPYLLLSSARQAGYEPTLIGQSRRVNEFMPRFVHDHILRFLAAKGKDASASRVFVVGFAFKGEPETSDMRDSHTLQLVQQLIPHVGRIAGYDPIVPSDELARIEGIVPCSMEEGFRDADAVVIMNNHRAYTRWAVHDLLLTMKRPALFWDGWRLFDPVDICSVDGITYGSVGCEYDGRLQSGVFPPPRSAPTTARGAR
jgi:UDP-N-acetyl-D-mannosaminuronic acid dehydrogenase